MSQRPMMHFTRGSFVEKSATLRKLNDDRKPSFWEPASRELHPLLSLCTVKTVFIFWNWDRTRWAGFLIRSVSWMAKLRPDYFMEPCKSGITRNIFLRVEAEALRSCRVESTFIELLQSCSYSYHDPLVLHSFSYLYVHCDVATH